MYNIKRRFQKVINIYHLIKAIVANIIYGFPSRKLRIIGVTGTDGKTTTAYLINHILKSFGKKVSIISTIYAKIGDEQYDTGLHTTTPDAILVQKLLKEAVLAGEEYFVLETTSHALDQNRVYGVNFEVSVITNITPEHIDYHKNFNNYLAAKAKLLLNSKVSVINADNNASFPRLKKMLEDRKKKYFTYGLKNKADFKINFRKLIDYKIADFNNYNYLASYSVASLLNIPHQQIINALKSFKLPPGRFELIYEGKFKIIIDFAHTPNSIENILKSIKEQYVFPNGRLIHVFGSAGLRDVTKRPSMGLSSGKYADVVILTEEDYRTEDPSKICSEIAQGLKKKGLKFIEASKLNKSSKKVYTIIINRDRAIKKAAEIASFNDIIVLTGKSHEKSLSRGKKEFPWDEEKAVFESLKKYDHIR